MEPRAAARRLCDLSCSLKGESSSTASPCRRLTNHFPAPKTWRKLWEQRRQLFPLCSSLYILYIFFVTSCCGLLGLQEKSVEEVLSFERVFLPCYFNAMGHMRRKTQTVKSICNRELSTPDHNISKEWIEYSVNTSTYFPPCVCLQTNNITFACTCIWPSFALFQECGNLDLKHFSFLSVVHWTPPLINKVFYLTVFYMQVKIGFADEYCWTIFTLFHLFVLILRFVSEMFPSDLEKRIDCAK